MHACIAYRIRYTATTASLFALSRQDGSAVSAAQSTSTHGRLVAPRRATLRDGTRHADAATPTMHSPTTNANAIIEKNSLTVTVNTVHTRRTKTRTLALSLTVLSLVVVFFFFLPSFLLSDNSRRDAHRARVVRDDIASPASPY